MIDGPLGESPLARLRRLEAEDAARRAAARRGPARGGPSSDPNRPADPSARRRGGRIGGIIGGLIVALAKGKALLVFLFTKGGLLVSAIKLSKLLATVSTMGISVVAFSRFYGWKFAAGMVLLILVHELGHGFAARRFGLAVGAPIFIPFFGAVITLHDQPQSTWVHSMVGYGGPLAGTLGGIAALAVGWFRGADETQRFMMALAHFTFLMNFFNLLPVGGLDGDRISEPFRTSDWVFGLMVTAAMALYASNHHDPASDHTSPQVLFAIFIVVLGIVKAVRMRRRARAPEAQRLVDRIATSAPRYADEGSVEPGQRQLAAVLYFGLIVVLSLLVVATELPPQ